MNKIYLYIISLILIVTFVITIVGVPINSHFCGKTGSKTANILYKPECACQSETQIEDKCSYSSDEVGECHHNCEVKEHKQDGKITFNNEKCCTDKSEVYAIDDDFISSSKNKLVFDFSLVQPLLNTIENSDIYKNIKSEISKIQEETMILGRKIILLLLFHSFPSENAEDSPVN